MTVTLLDARVETGGEPREETGRRQTLSDAIEHVLATSQLAAIADGRRPVEEWRDAWRSDTGAVHGIVDRLAEDLTRVTRGEVVRTSCLEFDPPLTLLRGAEDVEEISDAFRRAARRYVRTCLWDIENAVLFGARPCRMGLLQWRRAAEACVTWPCGCGGVLQVELENAHLTDAYDFVRATPRRVQRQLAALQETHFDYRPAVLVGDIRREGVVDPALVLRLGMGCPLGMDCPDLVSSYWRETPWQRVKLFAKIHLLLGIPLVVLVATLLLAGASWGAAMHSPTFERWLFIAGLWFAAFSLSGSVTLAMQFLRRPPLRF